MFTDTERDETPHAPIGSSNQEQVMCTPSVVLARLLDLPDESSEAAERGTRLHKCFESGIRLNYIENYNHNTEPFGPKSHFRIVRNWTHLPKEERDAVDFALDGFSDLLDRCGFVGKPKIETEKTLSFDRHAKYPMFGTADVLMFGENTYGEKIAVVVDAKFGQRPVFVDNNRQLHFLAGAAYVDGDFPDWFREADRIVTAIIQPDFPQNFMKDSCLQTRSYPPEYLKSAVQNMLSLQKSVTEQEETFVFKPGERCTYCKAKPICPVYETRAKELADFDYKDYFLDADRLGEKLAQVDGVIKHLQAFKSFAHTYMKEGGSITGFTMRPGRKTRSWGDEDQAVKKLIELGVNETHHTKVVSPAQAEKSLKALGKPVSEISEFIETRPPGLVVVPVSDTH